MKLRLAAAVVAVIIAAIFGPLLWGDSSQGSAVSTSTESTPDQASSSESFRGLGK